MTASRKLYKEVADSFAIVRKQYATCTATEYTAAMSALELIEEYIMLDFAKDNPNFNRTKFKKASRANGE